MCWYAVDAIPEQHPSIWIALLTGCGTLQNVSGRSKLCFRALRTKYTLQKFEPIARRQELAAAVAAEGLRPILALDTPPQLGCLLEAAWQLQPEQRPTAAQLEAVLRIVVENLKSSTPSLIQTHTNGISNGFSTEETGTLLPSDDQWS